MIDWATPKPAYAPGVRSRSIFDGWLLLAAALLIAVGLMALYSHGYSKPAGASYFPKQIQLLVLGIVPFALFYFVDTRFWRKFSNSLYLVNIGLLSLVFLVGSETKGAQRWIQLGSLQFQPSEMSKLLCIMTLSAFFASRIGQIKKFSTFALSFLHVLPPLLLVFKQPHLGATLVILVAWLGVCVCAGVPWKYLLATVAAAAAALVLAMTLFSGVLKSYQKTRVQAMFSRDEKGSAYQTLRASIAFASGGVVGTGYLQGEQKRGGYIPEQHNDFIFTVIGEEGGLIGAGIVLSFFGFFFYRVWLVIYRAIDPYSRMLAGGIFSMLGFHTLVNLAMNVQLVPVVGLWLPFVSYGGTALWLCLAAVGLLLNLSHRSKSALFEQAT